MGWDRKRKRHDKHRQVTVVQGNYVVIVAVTGKKRGRFITAYVADTAARGGRPSTIDLIRRGPKWA